MLISELKHVSKVEEPIRPVIRSAKFGRRLRVKVRRRLTAGRRLMAEKADWVGPDNEISVNLRSALEWRPDEWG